MSSSLLPALLLCALNAFHFPLPRHTLDHGVPCCQAFCKVYPLNDPFLDLTTDQRTAIWRTEQGQIWIELGHVGWTCNTLGCVRYLAEKGRVEGGKKAGLKGHLCLCPKPCKCLSCSPSWSTGHSWHLHYTHTFYLCMYSILFKREGERDKERSSICWFALQIPATVDSRSPQLNPGFPCEWKGPENFSHCMLCHMYVSRKVDLEAEECRLSQALQLLGMWAFQALYHCCTKNVLLVLLGAASVYSSLQKLLPLNANQTHADKIIYISLHLIHDSI